MNGVCKMMVRMGLRLDIYGLYTFMLEAGESGRSHRVVKLQRRLSFSAAEASWSDQLQ